MARARAIAARVVGALPVALALAAVAAARQPPPGAPTGPAPGADGAPALPAQITIALDRPVNAFRPELALGAALDGHNSGETAQIYTRANERAMASAGLGAVTYRLRTELGAEAWHYAGQGRWSDRARSQGYWTGASTPHGSQATSWGYQLPRRGDTFDQAEDSGYSRLDDGDPATFWKSNPYLDAHFTHEADALHPQWIVVDLQRARPVDAVRLDWYAPYAERLHIQRFLGPSAILLAGHPPGRWTDFPHGAFAGHSGRQLLRVAPRPMRVRFLRVLMSGSSHIAPPGSRDIRDRLGYAVREIAVGTLTGERLHDLIRHGASQAQTAVYVSSTDPWHRAYGRDPLYEQPSFQTVLSSGLTRGLPALVPVPVLYGTPDSAVAELRYVRALGVPIRGVELGEEPDGQLIQPEDYAALYVQFARAIHRAFPTLALGGPGFQTSVPDWLAWPDARGERSWVRRFLTYLTVHRSLSQLSFFSFEWYPFDNACLAPGPQLARASQALTNVMALTRAHGLPSALPIYVTEYGYSAFAGQAEVDLPGALLDADAAARFLTEGGTAAYLYGYEPSSLMQELPQCRSPGNLTLLLSDDNHRVRQPVAAYWAMRLLTQDWSQPGAGLHRLYAARSSARDAGGRELVRAYPLVRPDGRLSVLLLNLDPAHSYDATLSAVAGGRSAALAEPWSESQVSGATYAWHPAGPSGRASPDAAPARAMVGVGAPVHLPAYSITVLSGVQPAPIAPGA